MDKKSLSFSRKMRVFCLLSLVILLLGGCATTHGLISGIAEDTQTFCKAMLKADEWVKENLW